ncbi:unnamed protein product, partial [Mesorhabditis belari]|uniref:Uncharacterized protein n=1 Tax=Mesorhabditis belari TaxID=2138241 RepID=A0AAF3EGV4_9BILA
MNESESSQFIGRLTSLFTGHRIKRTPSPKRITAKKFGRS